VGNLKRLSPEQHLKLANLRSRFVPRQCFHDLSDAICNLEDRRRVEISEGLHPEARGLAVIGNSGSGKSTGLGHFFRKSGTLSLLADGNDTADVASFLVPSPATLKGVGISCLSGLGYPLMRDRTAGIIWQLVQGHLRELKVMFLHLDEAQDLMGSQSKPEMVAVVNTLKGVMQNPHWPVSIVLSGLPELLTLLNLDTQLGRRFAPIYFSPLNDVDDGRNVRSLVCQYCAAIAVDPDPELQSDDFISRLIHAAANEFGILIEIVIGAIEICIRRNETILAKQHFVAEFLRRTGCANDLNPFVRTNFTAIDPKVLLPGHNDSSSLGTPKRRDRKK